MAGTPSSPPYQGLGPPSSPYQWGEVSSSTQEITAANYIREFEVAYRGLPSTTSGASCHNTQLSQQQQQLVSCLAALPQEPGCQASAGEMFPMTEHAAYQHPHAAGGGGGADTADHDFLQPGQIFELDQTFTSSSSAEHASTFLHGAMSSAAGHHNSNSSGSITAHVTGGMSHEMGGGNHLFGFDGSAYSSGGCDIDSGGTAAAGIGQGRRRRSACKFSPPPPVGHARSGLSDQEYVIGGGSCGGGGGGAGPAADYPDLYRVPSAFFPQQNNPQTFFANYTQLEYLTTEGGMVVGEGEGGRAVVGEGVGGGDGGYEVGEGPTEVSCFFEAQHNVIQTFHEKEEKFRL